jgi:hypothetical protein
LEEVYSIIICRELRASCSYLVSNSLPLWFLDELRSAWALFSGLGFEAPKGSFFIENLFFKVMDEDVIQDVVDDDEQYLEMLKGLAPRKG